LQDIHPIFQFIHNNKIDNDIFLNVQYIKTNKRIYTTDQNDGFIKGGLEAVSDCIDMLNLKSEDCEYDWVLHMHPDVFIINEGPILKLLTQELNTDNVFYVNYSLNNKVLYSFDMFLFKPRLLKTNILKDWRECVISPEFYLYQQIIRVLLIDTSGGYFTARYDPVYAKQLTINKGVDNVLLFEFINQQEKPVNITGSTFLFRAISTAGDQILVEKELV
jgi:hypothetical protein